MLVLKYGLESQLKSDFTLILNVFENSNYFKNVLNLMFYKMTLLPLPWSSGRDRKRVSEQGFQT